MNKSDNIVIFRNLDHQTPCGAHMADRKPLALTLSLLILLMGCLSIPEEQPSCDEGLSFIELVDDSENLTVANIRLADIDGDGKDEILSTRPLDGLFTIANCDSTDCEEEEISDGLIAPVRTHVVDLNGDNISDIVVADIGILQPANEKVGKVILFEGTLGGGYVNKTLIEGIGRTVCAESADFDADGDLDLVVCEFGHEVGSIFWLEQDGNNWTKHSIDERPGAIHAYPFDVEGDGDIDIAVSLSQLSEEVNIYRNNGQGNFTKNSLINKDDTYFGMSGLELSDLDQDGDMDIIYTNGDTLDMDFPANIDPNTYHGVNWLENDGNGNFVQHSLVNVWGAFTAHATDIDFDGDLDIIVGTMQITDLFPESTRTDLLILENNGEEQFSLVASENLLRYLITMDSGDINGDGEVDLVAGSHRIMWDGPSHRSVELIWTTAEMCET